MNNAAISISDIIRKRQSIKWTGYQYLKYLIKQAYDSPDLYYQEEIKYKLHLLSGKHVRGKHVSIHSYFNKETGFYVVGCQIK